MEKGDVVKDLNRMAMDLVGDLQLSPADQYYEKAKQYLKDAWKQGMTDAAEECYLVAIHGTDKIMNASSDEIKKRIATARDSEKIL